jgi:hypothetical protein
MSTRLHGIIYKKIVLFIAIAMRTSDITVLGIVFRSLKKRMTPIAAANL